MAFGNSWILLLFLIAPVFIWVSLGQLLHFSRLRRWSAIGLRLLLLTLLIFALADARWLRQSDALSVIFLVDQSDSLNNKAKNDALKFIQTALETMPLEDTAGIIAFGENALVEETPRSNLSLNGLVSTPQTGYTNIADAIRLGMALFPANQAKRMVLLSDGQNNLGDAKTAARLASANGIELVTVLLENSDGPEVRLDQLNVPSTLSPHERFDLEVIVNSNQRAQTELQIYADGQLLDIKTLNLENGFNRFLFPMIAGSEGFSTFQVRLNPETDTQSQNNRLDAYSLIEGPAQVLIVARNPNEVTHLIPALENTGIRTVSIRPESLPSSATDLGQYAAIILVNVPAFTFSPSQLNLLQVYVRDLGHGLIVIGGTESFGAGGYYQTPLEETLPVDMRLRDKERLPGMSMFMVIDKSGSMETGGTPTGGGPRKVELAKEAIYRALDLLTPLDRIGIIAFDNAARWVVRPTAVTNVGAIKSRVGTIRADGGTDILAGLQAATEIIKDEISVIRHIVLLTDGGANPSGIPELVDTLVEQGVSISVVAIGDGYAPFLEQVAIQGGGRFHFARDASTIPQIFAQEATLAQKAYIIEETFTPRLTAPSPILRGITALPNLHGYIGTSAKLTAQTILISDKDDPILAQWQYGLGRAVAWTSDVSGQWGQDWVQWEIFPQFWGQAVRWTIVETTQGGLETRITLDQETGNFRLSVEALDAKGNYLNNLNLSGSLVAPDLTQSDLTLTQVAPGLYEAELRPDETGAYLLRVLGTDDTGQLSAVATQGFVVNYSSEYLTNDPEAGKALMEDLADLGQGYPLALADTQDVFTHNLPPVRGANPLWPTLLTLFVCLLPLDVGVRRIVIGREELTKLTVHLSQYFPKATPKPASVAPTASSASSLLSIKRQNQSSPTNPATTDGQPATASDQPRHPDQQPLIVTKPEQPSATSQPQQPSQDQDALTGTRMTRLLNAKRRANQQPKKEQ